MPAVRDRLRQSGRLGNKIAVIYDKDGWPVPQSIPLLDHHNHQAEPLDGQAPPIIPPSVVTSPSHQPNPTQHSHQKEPSPPIAPPNVPFFPSDPPSFDSSTLPLRNTHNRRRDPSHVPRPRNAFIFFRSSYISSGSGAGEGQQNELSKQAGKVWNKLTEEEQKPYKEMAALEKAEHRIKYPNYVYAPGRGGAKGKTKAAASGRRRSGMSKATMARMAILNQNQKRRAAEQWSRSSLTSSSEPGSPEPEPAFVPPPPRAPRIIRAAAQRAAVRLIVRSPSPSPSPRLSPAADERPADGAFAPAQSPSPSVDDDFVPTSEIPVLELTPSIKQEEEEEVKEMKIKKEPEPEPKFDPVSYHPHLDREPQQFGFKPYLTHAAMYASLPALPRTGTASPFAHPVGMSSFPIPPLNLTSLPSQYQHTLPSSSSASAQYSLAGAGAGVPIVPGVKSEDTLMEYYTDQLVKLSTAEPVSHEEWCRYQLQHPNLNCVPQDDVVAMGEYFAFEEFEAAV